MQGAKIKISFFEKEIEYISELKSKLEGTLQLTKEILKTS